MKEVKKALFYKSGKRIALLTFMLSFVMLSLYLTFSLHFSKFRIEEKIAK